MSLFLCPNFLPRHVRGTALNPCSQPILEICALNYTGFPGLGQVAAESECGASLHGHKKCSQAGCLPVNRDLGESALEGSYT